MNNQPGIMQPSSKEIEEIVIGSLLIDSRCADDVMILLQTPNAFYYPEFKTIFTVIQDLFKANVPIDLTTVSQALRSQKKYDEVGGDYMLISLMQKVSSAAHVEYHSRLLQQFMLRRMIIEFNMKITGLAYSDDVDVFELLKKWSNEFDKVNDLMLTGRKTVTFEQSLYDVAKRVEFLSSKKDDELTGAHTGFARINKYTGGYKGGHVIVLAARPGMGKTSKVLKTALENVKIENAVGFISLEMPMMELTARMISLDSSFHLGQLMKTGFEKEQYFVSLSDHIHRMKDYPFFVDDSSKSDIVDVVVQARLWKREHNIQMLIVDYLQLMGDKSKGNNREQEISTISRRMKLLAKELDIPVIILSQLSREVEKRGGDKRPRLADLRESGAIEQDADIVEFIYRPGYYGIDVDDSDMLSEGTDTEIIFAKNRHGSVGTTALKWIGDKTKFVDPTDQKEEKYFKQDFALPQINPVDAFEMNQDNNNLPF